MICQEDKAHLYGVILAGGSGTRLWPLSRQLHPKQLLHLPGCRSGRSLLQETVARITAQIDPERVLIVTNQDQKLESQRQLDLLEPGLSQKIRILAEPVGRNTAPAIIWAAQELVEKDPQATMVVFPADHVLARPQYFWEALFAGWPAAQQDYLVTFGITPQRAETGYGYIQQAEALPGAGNFLPVFRVERFVEKPDKATALRYLEQGGFSWNSGIFLWKAAAFLQVAEKWQPQLLHDLQQIRKESPEGFTAEQYGLLKNISVDYAVMELHDRCAVIPLPPEAGWTDLGSWEAVLEVCSKDEKGNFCSGKTLTVDCRDSLFLSHHRLVAGLGLEGLIVVETPDAVLVARRHQVQEVKKLTDILIAQGAEVFYSPRTVYRPWGTFTVLEEGPGYKIKRIEVYPGGVLSRQYHYHRSEHWVVISGQARVTRGQEVLSLQPNESTFIPLEMEHRLENPGTEPVVIIEVQNGAYLGEDDIVRLEDIYGRQASN